ncbi:glycosyltransferase family 4 protein [Microbulbifer bruguierae]|uniref:Glycosyltransferase family 4 protein n=1 Tax=Microbulbifer bruguierae TaxID=3029061 RepID=A0ABY8NCG2_9GAMM|nr:glycosyltransferase family 4 protein [Microbulbifer bruguierae]WGL16390.1 glycosyltransferase family 4 protein [Microbulbifer bruguierae]
MSTENLSLARDYFYNKKYAEAAKQFSSAYKTDQGQWWLLLEQLRSEQLNEKTGFSGGRKDQKLMVKFYPDYRGNPYQGILYGSSQPESSKYEPSSSDAYKNSLDFLAAENRVYHVHWLKEVFAGAENSQEAKIKLRNYLGTLKLYKCLGVKILWTIHNQIDHDQPEHISPLLIELMKALVELCDCVLVHTNNTIEIMEAYLGVEIKRKAVVLEHPLYPDPVEGSEDLKEPSEFSAWSGRGKSFALSLGMIRPYKGVADLLDAFSAILSSGDKNARLVVAGRPMDPEVTEKAKVLTKCYPDNFLYISRNLSDAEVNFLYKSCEFSVLTYKKILISGSYYMAATHKKACIAPRIGMFQEKIVDGDNGLLYDGSIAGLIGSLKTAYGKSASELQRMGRLAHNGCQHTAESFSSGFYKVVEGL